MTQRLAGRVLSVSEELAGSTLTIAASASDTVLFLRDATYFLADGGSAVITDDDNSETITYESVDLDEDTITLSVGLVNAYGEEASVVLDPALPMRYAEVQPTGANDDTLRATVDTVRGLFLPVGTREDSEREQVVLIRDKEVDTYIVTEVYSNAEAESFINEQLEEDIDCGGTAIEVFEGATDLGEFGTIIAGDGITATDNGDDTVTLDASGGAAVALPGLDDVIDDLDDTVLDGDVLTYSDYYGLWIATAPSGGATVDLEDDTTPVGTFDTIDMGTALDVTDDGGGHATVDVSLGTSATDAAAGNHTHGGGSGSEGASDSEALGRAAAANGPGGGDDDEFDDGSVDGAWVDVHRASSPGTWVERYGRMTYVHNASATSSDLHGLVRPVTLSTGDYIETCFNTYARGSHAAAGLVFSNGTSFSSGTQVFVIWYNYGGTFFLRAESKSGWSGGSSEGTSYGLQGLSDRFYIRLRYEAANTWGYYISPDGFNFYAVATNQSWTMTPTHAGLVIHHHTAQTAPHVWADFDYFRVNPANE